MRVFVSRKSCSIIIIILLYRFTRNPFLVFLDLAERIHEIKLSCEQDNGSSDPGPSLQRAHDLRQNKYDISNAAALIVSTYSDTASDQVDTDRPF
jgi:hypothetical protein